MKRLVTVLLVLGITSTVAFANSLENFKNDVEKQGLELTVDNAVKAGAAVEEIVEKGLAVTEINPQNLVKALYCAGVQGTEIKAAAGEFNISEMIVEAGFQKSVAECGDTVADAQPFTPANAQGPSFSGRRANGGGNGNTVYASPSVPQ